LRSSIIRIFACFALVTFLTSAARAQQPSRLEEIVKRGTFRVGMTGDYAPFSKFDAATSTFRGFDVDRTYWLPR
jgi:cyclohexadienyl dehydratase